jgi:small subunit ribosomal protein S16
MSAAYVAIGAMYPRHPVRTPTRILLASVMYSIADDKRRFRLPMVKIRLMRMGMKGAPSYRVVVADARSPRDGRFIENIGWYNPLTEPSTIKIDAERARHWLQVGAQPTESVRSLLIRTGIVERPAPAVSKKK